MRILCFGDSNTRGYLGESSDGNAIQCDKPWPSILQELLPNDLIVADGVNGRVLNDSDASKKSYDAFVSQLAKGYDIVVLALGINDTKPLYNLSGTGIVELIEKFSASAIENGSKVVLVGPVKVDLEKMSWVEDFNESNNAKVEDIYTAFPHAVECRDLALIDDGLHLSESSHNELAKRVTDALKNS